MDRNVIIATVLISVIMLAWFYLTVPPETPPSEQVLGPDSSLVQQEAGPTPQVPDESTAVQTNPVPALTAPVAVVDSTIIGANQGEERLITVENDLYKALFSTKGATLVSFELKQYTNFDQSSPVQVVDTTRHGAIAMVFTTPTNHNIDTRSFFFDTDYELDELRLEQEGQRASIQFTTPVGQGRISKTYTFAQGTYEVDLSIDQENPRSFSTREGYDLVWEGGVPFSEGDHTQEAIKTASYFRTIGGDVEGVTLDKDSYEEKSQSGGISWVGVKNQYFAAVIMPQGNTRGAELIGERFGETDDPNLIETYTANLLMPAVEPGITDEFRMYLGPMEYKRIAQYDLDIYDMVDYGWDFFEWMTRPIARLVFIPLFTYLSTLIPNYGIIIILLAFLIKLVVYPLTKRSYRSMAQMRELQPKLEVIKEKHGDDPQKQQEATMKLYKESGVNPLGGCMPMLLQYPIIIALWQFLPQSIEIRQQGFLWANDLSAPDVILNLPFTIPFYGDFVAGFCMLMGISMVIQMRIQSTPSAGAQAKMIMYIMPVMIFVIFNRWASGLNLYYLCYNILTAIQQQFINKSIEKEKANKDDKPRPAKNKAAKVSSKAQRVKTLQQGRNKNGRNGSSKAKDRKSSRIKR